MIDEGLNKLWVEANEPRKTGPLTDSWPREIPHIVYITHDSGSLCVTCANQGNGSLAAVIDGTADQWRIIGAQVNTEDTEKCDHCGRFIPRWVLNNSRLFLV